MATTSDRARGLDIDLLTTDRVAFARIAGELDASTAPSLIRALERLLEGGSRDVVLDCAELAFCDSMGLRALVVIRNAQPDGATFSLVRLQGPVRRVIEVSGLAEVFVLS
jgi:anti-anti-sigma factor